MFHLSLLNFFIRNIPFLFKPNLKSEKIDNTMYSNLLSISVQKTCKIIVTISVQPTKNFAGWLKWFDITWNNVSPNPEYRGSQYFFIYLIWHSKINSWCFIGWLIFFLYCHLHRLMKLFNTTFWYTLGHCACASYFCACIRFMGLTNLIMVKTLKLLHISNVLLKSTNQEVLKWMKYVWVI